MRTNRPFFWVLASLLFTTILAHAEPMPGRAVVKGVTGKATYTDSFGFSHALSEGTVLKQGDTITTGADASVDLFLNENGPGARLEADSVLRLEKLTAQKSLLGTLINTRLDLQKGSMYGVVNKLLAGSTYEIQMPNSVASVRGTQFFVSASLGTVFVTSGTVVVTVTGIANGLTVTQTVSVTAGHVLYIPEYLYSNRNLVVQTTPAKYSLKILQQLAAIGALTQYNSSHATSRITETYRAEKMNKFEVELYFPPRQITVSL